MPFSTKHKGNRLQPHILNELLCRLSLNESPTKIERQLKVSRTTMYTIRDNIEYFGVPYPLKSVVLGRLKLITRTM